MGLDTKTYWLADCQSQCDFDLTRYSDRGKPSNSTIRISSKRAEIWTGFLKDRNHGGVRFHQADSVPGQTDVQLRTVRLANNSIYNISSRNLRVCTDADTQTYGVEWWMTVNNEQERIWKGATATCANTGARRDAEMVWNKITIKIKSQIENTFYTNEYM
jgi:hypothetical protein